MKKNRNLIVLLYIIIKIHHLNFKIKFINQYLKISYFSTKSTDEPNSSAVNGNDASLNI